MTDTGSNAYVATAPGPIDRTCATCGRPDDGAPMHVLLGLDGEMQFATLADGRLARVVVVLDEAHHITCHDCPSCADTTTKENL